MDFTDLEESGLLVAPAGHGKTQLICEMARVERPLPALILTHTRAGKWAIERRMRELGVPSGNYTVRTITSWASWLSRSFPQSSAIPGNKEQDIYRTALLGAQKLLANPAIVSAIKSTYSTVIVDEYQDCDQVQHQIFTELKQHLSVKILADPLQGIFEFAGVPEWRDVTDEFPVQGVLDRPWRWENKSPDLGQWISDIREPIAGSNPIDLRDAPDEVNLQVLDPRDIINQRNAAYQLLRTNGTRAIIFGDSRVRNFQNALARRLGGTFQVVEASSLSELRKFFDEFEGANNVNKLLALLRVLKECSTQVSTLFRMQIQRLEDNRMVSANRLGAENAAILDPLIAFVTTGSVSNLRAACDALERHNRCQVFRKPLIRMLLAVFEYSENNDLGLEESFRKMEAQDLLGRENRRVTAVIGSPLTLKGLEYDNVLIVGTSEWRPKEFYVAISRASGSITILTESQVINFE